MCLFESRTTLVMAGDSVTDVGRTRPIAENRKEDLGRGYPAVVDALLTACRPASCSGAAGRISPAAG